MSVPSLVPSVLRSLSIYPRPHHRHQGKDITGTLSYIKYRSMEMGMDRDMKVDIMSVKTFLNKNVGWWVASKQAISR